MGPHRVHRPEGAFLIGQEKRLLKSVPAKASLVVCSTCRLSQEAREDAQGRRGGIIFAQMLTAALADHPCRDRIAVQQMPCLFVCSDPCSVYLRADGRMGYVLGKFAPDHQDAVALLDYIAHYLDSETGIVPYAVWPDGVKGHFLVRVPPQGFVWDPPDAVSNAEIVATLEGN
jgi:predicted metal-binding protein